MKNKFDGIAVSSLKNGYTYEKQTYKCLFCSAQYEDGDIYTFGSRMVNAEKAMKLHISEKHGDVFTALLSTDKAQTGLTDTQKEYLAAYYSGLTDKEIAENMNITPSTVRYQRFNFNEKAKQARMVLALSELLENREVAIESDAEKALNAFFESTEPLILKSFNVKRKHQLFILQTIVGQFERGKTYTDREVNDILKPIYDDFPLIRRSLIDDGFMARTNDCREYWVK